MHEGVVDFRGCVIPASGAIVIQVSADDFFNSLYSQAVFLEQCVGNKVISETNIHNHNIKNRHFYFEKLQNFASNSNPA